MTAGIRVNDVSFSYGSTPVLEGINLLIPEGQIWGLVGRSGSGKTTLLNVVAGLYTPRSGSVTVTGRGNTRVCPIRGVVFQEDSLLGWLSALDNILFPQYGNSASSSRERAETLLEKMGLARQRATLPHQLSAGMRKRVEFARALLVDSEYILMDEPFGSLDALTRRELWKTWFEIRQSIPRTGIISTHDPEEAIRMCDVVVTLRSGVPGTITNQINVPPSIGDLKVSEQNNEVWRLCNEITSSLAATT